MLISGLTSASADSECYIRKVFGEFFTDADKKAG